MFAKLLYDIRLYLFCVISIFFGCKKFVEISAPTNKLISSSVFNTDASATSAVTGIYTRMFTGGFASGSQYSVTQLSGLSSDEFTNYFPDPEVIEFADNSLSSSNAVMQPWLWSEPYQYIYTANAIIEGLNASTNVSGPLKQQLNGEARFLRAFCYFYLTNLFGDVPLDTTSNYQVNSSSSRTPSAQVYQQIIVDLKNAQSLLSSDYSFSNGERLRPNQSVATSLLARVYLYTQQWDSAEVMATKVISNSSLYQLVSLDSVFLANSTEAIWQLLPVEPGLNTNEGFELILTAPPQILTLSNFLVNAFENGDNRFAQWVGNYTDGVTVWYFPSKYKVQASSAPPTEYSMVLRLSEQYLIRAEAEANGSGNGIPASIADLNVIRNRAGLANTTAVDRTSLLTAIEHERQIELFSEWGHRWLDLVRTNRANAVLGVEKPGWKATDTLYPIPVQEILNNHKITQNPGY